MSRTRVSDFLVACPTPVKVMYTPGGVYQGTTALGLPGLSGWKSSITDETHPNFRERKKRGEIILGAMSLEKWARENTPGHIQIGWHPSWGKAFCDGDFAEMLEVNTTAPTVLTDVGRMSEVALVKSFAKAKSAPLMGIEALGELGKTVSMLRAPFSQAGKHIDRMYKQLAYMKRNWSKARMAQDGAQAAASVWLEGRFGMRPFVGDISTIINEAERKLKGYNRALLSVARSGEKASGISTRIFDQAAIFGDSQLKVSGSCTASLTVKVNSGLIYSERQLNALEQARKFSGTRACDLPAGLWELMRYSLVVDWFVNVGDWIQAVTPTPGFSALGNWVTSVSEYDVSASGNLLYQVTQNPATTYSGSAGSSHKTVFTMTRVVNQSLPSTPVLKMKPLSVLQSADAVGLLCQGVIRGLARLRH